jgi:hypothetical protein
MSFSGWKNVKPGEEFSIDEIAAHYGILGPYYLLESPSFTRWGRYPLMVRAVAKDGVENLFEPGEKVRVFMRPMPGENGVADYDLKAFPENIFENEETLRRFIDMAEERAIHQSDPKGDEPWSEMFCVFNMGHRLEMYVDSEEAARGLIDIARKYGIEAQIIGRVEAAEKASVTILHEGNEYNYNK